MNGDYDRTNDLYRRAAEVLGWAEKDAHSFSMRSLAEFVRSKDPGLNSEMLKHASEGRHIVGPRLRKRRL